MSISTVLLTLLTDEEAGVHRNCNLPNTQSARPPDFRALTTTLPAKTFNHIYLLINPHGTISSLLIKLLEILKKKTHTHIFKIRINSSGLQSLFPITAWHAQGLTVVPELLSLHSLVRGYCLGCAHVDCQSVDSAHPHTFWRN